MVDCRSDGSVYCNCGQHGRISTNCQKPKKPQSGGKVFTLTGTETTSDDRLIRGTCFINIIFLIAIIDTGATHSFVSLDYVESLGLKLSHMHDNMIVYTPNLGPVDPSWVCLNCPLTSYGENFIIDVVCITLRNLVVILEINWLEFNHIHINCFDKTMSFPEFDASDELFLSSKQVDEFVKDDVAVYMILASMKVESKVVIGELPVVCDFPEVFPDDISDFLSEHGVEFTIDLIPGTSPVSMAPYRMFASDLSRLKKQL